MRSPRILIIVAARSNSSERNAFEVAWRRSTFSSASGEFISLDRCNGYINGGWSPAARHMDLEQLAAVVKAPSQHRGSSG
jgi:hypothetical protein